MTFNAGAGAPLTLKLSGVTISSATVTILKPDGTTLTSAKSFGTSGTTVTTTAPVGGAYTIVLDPQAAAVGTCTLTLT